jgi:hypothetical protein
MSLNSTVRVQVKSFPCGGSRPFYFEISFSLGESPSSSWHISRPLYRVHSHNHRDDRVQTRTVPYGGNGALSSPLSQAAVGPSVMALDLYYSTWHHCRRSKSKSPSLSTTVQHNSAQLQVPTLKLTRLVLADSFLGLLSISNYN